MVEPRMLSHKESRRKDGYEQMNLLEF
jgi:hypothetical protein